MYGLVWLCATVYVLKLYVVLVYHEGTESVVVASGIAHHLVDNDASDS